MSFAERMARLSNKFYDRMRSKAAFTISADDAVERDFEPLRGHRYATLVSFRKSGEAMPSPVWFGLDDAGRAYLHTMHDSGKVKRIRNNGRALIVASYPRRNGRTPRPRWRRRTALQDLPTHPRRRGRPRHLHRDQPGHEIDDVTARHQPEDRAPDKLRVMLDPAGHPFCLFAD